MSVIASSLNQVNFVPAQQRYQLEATAPAIHIDKHNFFAPQQIEIHLYHYEGEKKTEKKGDGVTLSFDTGESQNVTLPYAVILSNSNGDSSIGTIIRNGATKFTVSAIHGAPELVIPVIRDGIDGKTPKGISSINIFFCLSASQTEKPADSEFTADTVASLTGWSEDKYLWQAQKTTYTDDTSAFDGKVCLGSCRSLATANEQYSLGTEQSAGNKWGDTYEPTPGSWLWQRTQLVFSDGKTTSYSPSESGQRVAYFAQDGHGYSLKGRAIAHYSSSSKIPTNPLDIVPVGMKRIYLVDEETALVQVDDSGQFMGLIFANGDGYLVDGYLWIWDEKSTIWNPVGNVQGPKGDPGTDAVTIELSTASILHNNKEQGIYAISFTVKDGTSQVKAANYTYKASANNNLINIVSQSNDGNYQSVVTIRIDKGAVIAGGMVNITVTYNGVAHTAGVPVSTVADGTPGQKGDRGSRGPVLRGPQEYNDISDGYQFLSGAEGESFYDVVIYGGNYYSCTASHVKSSDRLPGSTAGVTNPDGTVTPYWTLASKFDIVATKLLLAQYALIKNLGVEAVEMKDGNGNILFQVKDGNVTCKLGTFENITITGNLKGVSGTFYKLSALDNLGKIGASIYFSDNRLTFEGDIYNQGTHPDRHNTFRFYTGDIWGRGSFGTRCRNILVVVNNKATFYSRDYNNAGYTVNLESRTYNNTSYYLVPCYGENGDYSGFPVDTIIFKNTAQYRYHLLSAPTQRLMIVNSNDDISAFVYSNGNAIEWKGGMIGEVVQLPNEASFINPVVDKTKPGAGLLVGPLRDNNWG